MRRSLNVPAEDSIDVDIRVIPRASRDEVGGERAGRLVVRTRSAPVDDQANEAVCRALAHHFGVPRRRVELVSGHRSRDKTVRVNQVVRTSRADRLTAAGRPAGSPVAGR
ncbi:DUF167 domain-containing protein [Desertimonas flava]|jgi:uncharacterized protein (TIGR00251 family)|uniref:DUF167 domain-containing protein n=1 Tax=Desertimonas flava TaxID=2064846 RepID=UPI000E349AD7|nr:DUF167 domain-containing protein [Desertimonas flava]